MGLSATEITNSLATQFNVELQFYGGLAYNSLTLANYVSGAIDPSTAGWTLITERINNAGSFTYERTESSLRGTAQLNGTSYHSTYLGPGQAILCLRRITVAGVQTVPETGTWELWWLGQITAGNINDDYKHGGAWTRSIGCLDITLQSTTAPRLTAGRLNLLSNAAVTASSTLINPALEAGSGEFPGTLVDVSASNTNDDNLNTLWISNDAPSSTATAEPQGWINKVSFKPLTGYSQPKLWWIEFWCPTNESLNGAWYIRNKAGQRFDIQTSEIVWKYHQRLIVCFSQADWEAYTGGSANVNTILEVKSSKTPDFTLDPDDDWFELVRETACRAALAWNQDGSAPTGMATSGNHWTGNAIDVSDDLCPPGSGLQLDSAQDGNAAADYFITNLLIPGDDFTEDNPEWLFYTLETRTNALDGDVSAGASSITLNSTLGMLDAGDAICEADAFAYTGRTATTLTGVTGIGAHASGANVYQTLDSVTQYGWPCAQLDLLRPDNLALPRILNARIYMLSSSLSVPKTPADEDWELDYDGPVLTLAETNSTSTSRNYVFPLADLDGNARWVQYLLIVYDDFSDSARARANENRLWLAQTQIDDSGLGDLADISAYALASYIFNLAGTTTFLGGGPNSRNLGALIGEHATAIASYADVLNDLARVTGCIMDWDIAGRPFWRADMWWPMYLDEYQLTVRAALDATYLRGQVQYSGHKPTEQGARIHARTPDGLQQYDVKFPADVSSTSPLIEYDGLVVPSINAARLLAQALHYRAGLHYTTGPQEVTFTLKGPGEWLRPEQWLTLACFNTTGETVIATEHGPDESNIVSWLTESVTWTWGHNGKFPTWSATANCRRYWR